MTAQGSPRTRFKRAIERRSILNAEMAAHETGVITLEEALQLVALYCERADPRAERAMVRWLGRLFSAKRMELALAGHAWSSSRRSAALMRSGPRGHSARWPPTMPGTR